MPVAGKDNADVTASSDYLHELFNLDGLTAVVIGVEPVVMLLLAMVVGMFLADQLFAPKKSKH